MLYALVFPPLFFNTEVGEMLIGLYVVVLVYVLNLFLDGSNKFMLFFAGIVTGIMIMTKQSTACVPIVAGGILFVHMRQHHTCLPDFFKHVTVYASGALVVPAAFILYFAYHHALYDAYYYTVEFLLSSYTSAPVMKGNGILLAGSLLALTIPVVFPGTHTKQQLAKLCIGGLTLSLLPLLYPSFLSYRAYPLVPLAAIAGSMLIDEWNITNSVSRKVLILVSAAIFALGTRIYYAEYIGFIKESGLHVNQWLLDYGDIEYETATWIREQTNSDDRIMVYANSILYLLSNRLPANKYVDPFPYLLEPMDKTAAVFFDHPPRVFVYDQTLPDVHTGLETFPFISTLEQRYAYEKTIGTMGLYTLRTGQEQK